MHPATPNAYKISNPVSSSFVPAFTSGQAEWLVTFARAAPGSSQKESLSARERRKQRNERREQLKMERTPWKEEIENKFMEKPRKSPPKGLNQELDIGRLTAKGMQWWMIFVLPRMELDTADKISKTLSRECPGVEFEIFVPVIPSKRKLKDGSFSKSTQRLHPGCLFMKFVMTKEVQDIIKSVPGCKGFFGKRVGFYERIIMPIPIPAEDIDNMFNKVKEEEEGMKMLIEESEQEKLLKETAQKAAEDQMKEFGILNVGCKIRVTSGPYANFEGCIMSLPRENKVQALLSVSGQLTNAEINATEFEVIQSSDDDELDRI